jgi:mannitol/fructose-specific phosphotransferase system IIA component (Ntr-type)
MKLTEATRPRLSQLLSAITIELSLRGNDRDAVFQEMIDKIPDLAGKPEAKQALLSALREREKLCSTGLGDGVALPHTRNTIAGLADRARIVFGRHRTGLAYGAIDGAPVKLLFLLLAPTVSQHLQILARLSRLLREATLRQNLLQAEQPEQVLAFIGKAEQKWADVKREP